VGDDELSRFSALARDFCRMECPFVEFWDLMGVLQRAEDEAESEELDLDEVANAQASYKRICELEPNLDAKLQEATTSQYTLLINALNHGINQARSGDNNRMKTALIERLQAFDGSENLWADNKESRGFRNLLTGAFLCPVDSDYDNNSTREKLREGDRDLFNAGCIPRFLYPYVEQPSNPSTGKLPAPKWRLAWLEAQDPGIPIEQQPSERDGFCQGQLLVWAWKLLFLSPGAAAGKKKQPSVRKVNHVTLPLIAWTACVLCAALSSDAMFVARSSEHAVFDNAMFYHNILKTLQDPNEAESTSSLLEYWTRQVFPNRSTRENGGQSSTESTVAIFRARAAARAAARSPHDPLPA
jgi:hypothetical protein